MTGTHRVRMTILLAPMICGLTGCRESAVQPPEPRVEPVAIEVVSGSVNDAKAGEPLDAPFGIRVWGSDGEPMRSATVRWSVTEGSGHLITSPPRWPYTDPLLVPTGTDGTSSVTFLPVTLGTSTVTATLYDSHLEPVRFQVNTSTLVMDNGYWGYFLAPDGQLDATVPVGTTIEWLNRYPVLVEIFSVEGPEGAAPFSAVLSHDQRLRFVPDIAGSWVWWYRYIDETGAVIELDGPRTLTVAPQSP
jgi:hypothetical protein